MTPFLSMTARRRREFEYLPNPAGVISIQVILQVWDVRKLTSQKRQGVSIFPVVLIAIGHSV
jgi:hypothetical protein